MKPGVSGPDDRSPDNARVQRLPGRDASAVAIAIAWAVPKQAITFRNFDRRRMPARSTAVTRKGSSRCLLWIGCFLAHVVVGPAATCAVSLRLSELIRDAVGGRGRSLPLERRLLVAPRWGRQSPKA
jgi:hypothetical protein